MKNKPKLFFSDYFKISEKVLADYGAYNISLITDLPLFIDPFLLFTSGDAEYQKLHDNMIKYLRFLKNKSVSQSIDKGLLKEWYCFKEIKQTWLGFSRNSNDGRGLGTDFAEVLNKNLHTIFTNFGEERITNGSHLERLCLIEDGIGKDNISDFTTNLIKEFLLVFTDNFARKHLKLEFCKTFVINRVRFNYQTESWERGNFYLPVYLNDYVLLTPTSMLTQDENWINKKDLIKEFELIPSAIPNDSLRSQINNYFIKVIPEDPTVEEEKKAIHETLYKFPIILDYFIKRKEKDGDRAKDISTEKVKHSIELYFCQFKQLVNILAEQTKFYSVIGNTYKEVSERVKYFKSVIEDNGGYKLLYDLKGRPIKSEDDLQILFRFVWHGSPSDVSSEVNDGRGPVDFKISRGAFDKTLIEFKLAKNTHLKKNLKKQLDIYKRSSRAKKGIYVIIFFTDHELEKCRVILKELSLENSENIVLIDARNDNKPSASKA